MKRITIALGAVLAWVCGVFGATHEGVQLWENGPLWAKTQKFDDTHHDMLSSGFFHV